IFNAIPPNWFANISKLEYDGRHLLERFTEHAHNIKSLSFGFHTFTQKLISKISSLISFQNNLVDLDLYLGYNEDYIDSDINTSDISEVILTLIEKVHSLKSLSLASGGNGIVQDFKELEMLSRHSNLERLNLRNVEFTVNDYDDFSIDIKFSKLVSLELFDVRMASQYSEKSLIHLIEQMMKNSNLISLDLEPYIGDNYDKLLEFIPSYCT
ncbi:603_t:CDS:1, partial [Racocetra persica]